MINYKNIIIALCIIFYSCTNKKIEISYSDLETISACKDPVKLLNSKEISDSVKYIRLETTEDCLIREIEQIKTDDGIFIIRDEKGIYTFDNNGRFIAKIGDRGQGPEEYISILSFFVDRNNKNITIIDNMKNKFLVYSYTGKFLRSVEVKDIFFDTNYSELNDNGLLLANNLLPSPYTTAKYEYQLFDILDDKCAFVDEVFPFLIYGGDISTRFSYLPISYCDGHLLFASSFSNILYELTDNIKAKYVVKAMKDFPNESNFEKTENKSLSDLKQSFKNRNLTTGIRKICELPQYLFLLIDNYTLIWDKKNKIGIYNYFIEHEDMNITGNLLDFARSSSSYSGGFITPLDIDVLFSEQELIENSDNQKLKNVMKEISEEDNPILMINYFNDHFVLDYSK